MLLQPTGSAFPPLFFHIQLIHSYRLDRTLSPCGYPMMSLFNCIRIPQLLVHGVRWELSLKYMRRKRCDEMQREALCCNNTALSNEIVGQRPMCMCVRLIHQIEERGKRGEGGIREKKVGKGTVDTGVLDEMEFVVWCACSGASAAVCCYCWDCPSFLSVMHFFVFVDLSRTRSNFS